MYLLVRCGLDKDAEMTWIYGKKKIYLLVFTV